MHEVKVVIQPMKLRIEGNSIRLRLTQPELSRFGATGRVEETLRLADGRRLVYALHASQEVEGLTAWKSIFEDAKHRHA